MGISTEITRIQNAKQDLKTAINAKGGSLTTELIDDYAAAVTALSTSSGTSSGVVEKDVNFYDYDGTLVYSYTIAEANALSALPALPDHSGDDIPLTGQEWNWTLAQVQAVTVSVDIGALYVTTDGKTHYLVKITTTSGGTIPIYFTKTVVGDTLNIDYGGGQTYSNSTTADVDFVNSTALSNGLHDITVWLSAGASGTYTIAKNTEAPLNREFGGTTQAIRNTLYRVFIGDKVSAIGGYAFYYSYSLIYISLSSTSKIGYIRCFMHNHALRFICEPASSNLYDSTFGYCYSLVGAALRYNTSMESGVFSECSALKRMAYRGFALTGIFTNCYSLKFFSGEYQAVNYSPGSLANCYSLENHIITDGRKIGLHTNCYSLKKFISPSSISAISNSAFAGCYNLLEYDFSAITSGVPTLGTNVFSAISSGAVMKIPSALFETWSTATNWAAYIDYMVAV